MREDLRRAAASAGCGAIAGIAGTAAMSAFMFGAKLTGVLGTPPPKKITRSFMRVLGVRRRPLRTNVLTTAAHFAFGAGLGALYGLVGLALRPRSLAAETAAGSGYGVTAWAASYAGWIPAVGIMAPPWRDRAGRPAAMALGHAVFGATTALVLRALDDRRPVYLPAS